MKFTSRIIYSVLLLSISTLTIAQNKNILTVTSSVNTGKSSLAFDHHSETGWILGVFDFKQDQYLLFSLQTPGDVNGLTLMTSGISLKELQSILQIYVTYDPMNPGEALSYTLKGDKGHFAITFKPKYGAHVTLVFKKNSLLKPVTINEVDVVFAKSKTTEKVTATSDQAWLNPQMPVIERVEGVLKAMTPADKMELLREGWGIPGIPHLGIPAINKVEAVHGFSYGSGATIFPQAIALGATWDKKLIEHVAMAIGDETVSATTKQCWSPVMDVAQDARWGRCEETFGEDPVLVSEIGGAWIKGYQSKGLFTTPKHFAGHGAPLGGRDSHDIGLSEREMREIHLVPFRHVIKTYHCQSIMENYSDFLGVPVAKNKELLNGILREEWGFNGFIVSDCGAVENMTSRKHYTAVDYIDAANQALAAGIATNCGDTYNNPSVIEAAENGKINMQNLNNVCRTMLSTMFRNGLFENNPVKPLDWNKIYPGWNSPEHREMARQASRESIVLLENKSNILPLSKSVSKITVIGPGADDLQPGDYTPKIQPGQLISVLSGIKATVGKDSKIRYEKGCEFLSDDNLNIEKAVEAALNSDISILVLGDCSTSESARNIKKTSGEANDYASLILPGNQEKLLEAVCETGKPVVLILQSGRPYNLSYAATHCQSILVNWLPGQEGGLATADVLFGDYNPAGRLPMTFPRNVAQLPLYYNFKTSGRGYNYVDMEFYPLYSFGYGLSYTTFEYTDLKTDISVDGSLHIQATVRNTGKKQGDEVVQLYVTDMYASVKTRVMELKDFERITLKPGESRDVSFTLTPYQLSLLNDNMDRVVEKGNFKIMVGGSSPSFIATDKIKDSVGFINSSKGVNGTIEYDKSFASNFNISFCGIEENLIEKQKVIKVSVKNCGNLMDAGKITLYVNGIQQEDVHHYELGPNETKDISFCVNSSTAIKNLTITTKYKSISENY